ARGARSAASPARRARARLQTGEVGASHPVRRVLPRLCLRSGWIQRRLRILRLARSDLDRRVSGILESSPPAHLDVARIRDDFPILQRRVRGKRLVYLDNAATTQKPQAVIDRLVRFYREENANIHRGLHALSVEATDSYDAGREVVRRFLNDHCC